MPKLASNSQNTQSEKDGLRHPPRNTGKGKRKDVFDESDDSGNELWQQNTWKFYLIVDTDNCRHQGRRLGRVTDV